MNRAIRNAPALTALLLLLLTSCGSAVPPPLQFETEHFRYHSRSEKLACPEGLGDWLEHHYRVLSGTLGVSLPPSQKIDVYSFRDKDDLVANGCGEIQGVRPTGCARKLEVDTVLTYDPHELTHAYASLLGDPPLFFKEGLAETIGCELWADNQRIERAGVTIKPLFVTEQMRQLTGDAFIDVYGPAADFTRLLIDQYGWARYLDFYARTPSDASDKVIADSFRRSFDEDVDVAIDAWLAAPIRSREDVCIHLAECATPPIGDAGGLEMATLDCGQAVAPSTEVNPVALVRHLPVDQASAITLRARGVRSMNVHIRGCSGELRPSMGPFLVPGTGQVTPEQPNAGQAEVWTELAAGDYWLLAYMPLAPDNAYHAGDGAVSVDLRGAILNTTCNAEPVHHVSPETTRVTVRGSFTNAMETDPVDGLPVVGVHFQLDEPRTLATMVYQSPDAPYDGSRVGLCSDGCPQATPQSCSIGQLGPTSQIPFAGEVLQAGTTYTLVLAGGTGGAGYEFGLGLLK